MKASKKGKENKKVRFCLEAECKNQADHKGYCRLHYIANWRTIRLGQKIKAEQKLNSYVDRLAKKYPDKYLDKIKEGLEDEEKFKESMTEMDIDVETGNSETDHEFLEKLMRDLKDDFE